MYSWCQTVLQWILSECTQPEQYKPYLNISAGVQNVITVTKTDILKEHSEQKLKYND